MDNRLVSVLCSSTVAESVNAIEEEFRLVEDIKYEYSFCGECELLI